MKITQSRDYKKPIYALGVTAALLAASVTGCGNPVEKDSSPTKGSGSRTKSEFYSKYDADKEVIYGGDVAIEGEYVEPDVELDGVTAIETSGIDDTVFLVGEETVYDGN